MRAQGKQENRIEHLTILAMKKEGACMEVTGKGGICSEARGK
jgi:hypothetical protein